MRTCPDLVAENIKLRLFKFFFSGLEEKRLQFGFRKLCLFGKPFTAFRSRELPPRTQVRDTRIVMPVVFGFIKILF